MPYLIDHTYVAIQSTEVFHSCIICSDRLSVKWKNFLCSTTIPVIIIISLAKFVAKFGIEGPNCSDDHHLRFFQFSEPIKLVWLQAGTCTLLGWILARYTSNARRCVYGNWFPNRTVKTRTLMGLMMVHVVVMTTICVFPIFIQATKL